MKNYSSVATCCHAFANNHSEDGKSSNVFFYKNKIYSYGYHYVLAEQFTNFTILNNKGYSNSTAKHINYMINAINGQYHNTMDIIPELVYNQLISLQKLLNRAKKPIIYLTQIWEKLNVFFEFWSNNGQFLNNEISFCGFDLDKTYKEGKTYFDMIEEFYTNFNHNTPSLSELREKAAEQNEITRELKEKREKAKFEESLKNFLNYTSFYVNYRPSSFKEVLRISKDKMYIETSQGAKVSARSAKVLFEMIKANKDIKGHQIDGYTVISINGTLKIGCHDIDMTYVKKIGNKLLTLNLE